MIEIWHLELWYKQVSPAQPSGNQSPESFISQHTCSLPYKFKFRKKKPEYGNSRELRHGGARDKTLERKRLDMDEKENTWKRTDR